MLGVGWYRPEQWELLLAESVDRDELESTHAEWLAQAERSLARIRAAGHKPIKIDIDVEDLIAWCANQEIPIDGNARRKGLSTKHYLWSLVKDDIQGTDLEKSFVRPSPSSQKRDQEGTASRYRGSRYVSVSGVSNKEL